MADTLNRNEKSVDVRAANITAARAVSDAIRTSLGPRAMDKMIEDGKQNVTISNDGATILRELSLKNPVAKMLVDLSASQDVEAGDGTTTVVVMAGAFLEAAEILLGKGVHPQKIADAFKMGCDKGLQILEDMSIPLDVNATSELTEAATTSLSSKVVAQNASVLAPLAVQAVLTVAPADRPGHVDLRDVRIVKKLGGTIEQSELVEGIVLGDQFVSKGAGGPSRVENARIGLIQFCLSPPKTDVQGTITIKDYQAMDRLRREEKTIIAKQVKAIQATGCNCLFIQKSILRDAVTDLSLDYLAKAKILVVRDIERDDIESIARATGCTPVAAIEYFTANRLGHADLVAGEELSIGGKIVKITGVPGPKTVSFLCRASNHFVLDEVDRSFHDALCVVRSLLKKRAVIPGGGCPEMELSHRLKEWSRTLPGVEQLCIRIYAESLQLIASTLAENAGLNTVETLTELINAHAAGKKYHGVSVKGGARVADMREQRVLQPLLVSSSALTLSTEAVMMILKIDDILLGR